MAVVKRPPHLLPSGTPRTPARLLNETPLEAWREEVGSGRGGILTADKLAALAVVLMIIFSQISFAGVPAAEAAPVETLWMTTRTGVPSPSGAPGLDSWTAGEVIEFGGALFALEPGTTGGAFSSQLNFDSMAEDSSVEVDGIHHVTTTLVLGSANSVTVVPGDVLFSTELTETMTSNNSVTVDDEDIVLFHPDSVGDYATGTFTNLVDLGSINADDTRALTLVEHDTMIGDRVVNAGSFLIAHQDRRDIILLALTDVGPGTTVGLESELADGLTMNFGSELWGLELVESAVTIAGVALSEGHILGTLNIDNSTIGTAGRTQAVVDSEDIFYLNIVTTGTSPVADGFLLFEGSDVALNTSDEEIVGLAFGDGVTVNNPPVAVDDSATIPYQTATIIDVLVNDGDPDGDGLIVNGIGAASHGTTATNATHVTYTPNAGYTGPDSFNYTVSDGSGGFDTATVTVDVTANFLVNSTDDDSDASVGDGSCSTGQVNSLGNPECTLRAAIAESNFAVGADTIEFGIPRTDGNYAASPEAFTIRPGSLLPEISTPMVIDASTQPEHATAGRPVIEVDGTNVSTSEDNGFWITGGGTTVRGFVLNNWGDDAIDIEFNGGNTIVGNYIGTDVLGSTARPNEWGINIKTSGNIVGGATTADRNVVSGNNQEGVYLKSSGSTGNVIQGNYVGTTVGGDVALPNRSHGVVIFQDASGNTIGGPTAAHGNIVSGNGTGESGIYVEGAATSGNIIRFNRVGTNAAGTAALPNNLHGIWIDNAPDTDVLDNLISGNDVHGIYVYNTGATGTEILRNTIGTNLAVTSALPNGFDGVRLEGSSTGTTVGASGSGNVISGNTQHGINLNSSSDNTVQANAIGTDVSGTVDLGNGWSGVYFDSFNPANNLVGGAVAGGGNTIAFNAEGITSISLQDNAFVANSIYSNDSLGIDLNDDGASTNDGGDGDSGANGTLNFPVITAATESGGTVTVDFGLDVPSGNYRVEFFANSSGADLSGYGEGQAFLTSVDVSVTGGVPTPGSTTFTGSVGDIVTATATEGTTAPFGATSEFSSAYTVTSGTPATPPSALSDPQGGGAADRYSAEVNSLSPVSYWRLGESAGPIAADEMGSNDGTYSGPSFQSAGALAGDTDTAAGFDGSDDYVDVGTFDLAGGGLTLTGWINADSFVVYDARMITKATDIQEADHTWMLSTTDVSGEIRLRARLKAGGSTDTVFASSGILQSGQWHFAAMTYDETDVKLYLDGVEVGSAAHSVGGPVDAEPAVPVWIGANPPDATVKPFDGRIDEVAVFDRALTAAEIRTLHGAGRQYYTITQGGSLTTSAFEGTLTNDTDPGGDALTAGVVSGPSHADSFTLNADGSFDYTPTPTFSGTDSFVYQACNSDPACDTATATITVAALGVGPGGVAADLDLWLRGDVGVTHSGGTASAWADQSSAGNDAAAPTTAHEPAYVADALNGNPVLDFDGFTDLMDAPGGGSSATYYLVLLPGLEVSATSAIQTPISFDCTACSSNAGGLYLGSATATLNDETISHGIGSATEWRSAETGAATYAADEPMLIAVRDDALASGTDIFQMGAEIDNVTAGSFMSVADEAATIGASNLSSPFATTWYDGQVAEVITYSTRSSDAEHQRIQTYLALKYGLTLDQTVAYDYVSSDGTVIWDGTTNAAHNDDIAGIGKDDGSALNQVQSTSINTGSPVSVSTPSSLDDGDFLVWGNDGGPTTWTTTGSPVGQMLQRTWRVEETGDVGTVSVAVDVSGLGAIGSAATDFHLLVDSDTDFSTGATDVVAASYSGGIATFTAVSVVDGSYFTVAATPSGFIVNSTDDTSDGNLGDGVCHTLATNTAGNPECTLRAAIEESNASAGTQTVTFAMPASELGHNGGVWTISPASVFPQIAGAMSIDGTSQTGWAAAPVVEIEGSSAGVGADGFRIGAPDVTIRGLAINRFDQDGIEVAAAGAVIEANHIGVDPTGMIDRGNGQRGVDLGTGASTATVGGVDDADRNIISGNGDDGIIIWNSNSNTIIGNYIGTDVTGNAAIGNGADGVALGGTSAANLIGQPGDTNLISGNVNDGIENDASGINNSVYANVIGLGIDGNTLVPNGRYGVVFYDAANTGFIYQNLIAGNGSAGVAIDGNSNAASTGTLIAGNYIGTDVTGLLSRGNGTYGVHLFAGTHGNTIGGTSAANRNIISGNGSDGVFIEGADTTLNIIQGNYIGLNDLGTAAVPNAGSGIDINWDAGPHIIGGAVAEAGNVISGNTYGVYGYGVDNITVQGNIIGLNAAGTATLPNINDGIVARGDSWTIGGATSPARNIISGNGRFGIFLDSATNTDVEGNYVGTDVTGLLDLGNSNNGVYVSGDTVTISSNVVSGNGVDGVQVGASSTGVTIKSNLIGLGSDALTALGNSFRGLAVFTAGGTTIGGSVVGEGNKIAHNSGMGIGISSAADNVTVLGNSIHSNSGIGFDIGLDGVTANDAGDGDTGANDYLNFPIITSGDEAGGTLTINFDLDAPPGDYRIEFFTNTVIDPSGNGEGETLAGTYDLVGHPGGSAGYSTSFAGASGDIITMTTTQATSAPFGATSEFSPAFVVSTTHTISGTVFEDVAGDVLNDGAIGGVSNPGAPGVDVYLYLDDGDGILDGGDTLIGAAPVQTDASGDYSVAGLSDGDYFVVVDSKTVAASQDATAVQGDIWAEQTFGPDGGYCDSGIGYVVRSGPGPCYGGISSSISDDFSQWDDREHRAVLTLAGGSVADVDFGFSFNVVTTTNGGNTRDDDVSNARTVQGSLRQFIQNANAMAGPNGMRFVPADPPGTTDGGGNFWWTVGVSAALPAISGGSTAIDGTAYDLADGISVREEHSTGPELALDGAGSTGLTALSFTAAADLSRASNLMITAFDNDAVYVASGAVNVTVSGNWIGSDGSGAASMGNGDDGIDANGVGVVITGNVINHSGDEGIDVRGSGATITGNIIGLEPDGSSGSGNLDVGIALFADGATIGGSNDSERNVISNNWEGIEVNSSNNTITGNYIGTDGAGIADRGNRTGDGIDINSGTGNVVGGIAAGQGNVVAFNRMAGVDVSGSAEVTVLGNVLHSNDELGINLTDSGDPASGVTANDTGDGDAGPNDLLNYPIISAASEVAGTVTVDFALDVPDGDYRIEFFNNTSSDPTGYGEGEARISSVSVSVTSGVVDPATHTFGGSVGDIITATATRGTVAPFGATSEFSAAVAVVQGAFTVNATGDAADQTAGDGACFTGSTNSAGAPECTLRAAIEETNAKAGTDAIVFDIPDSEPGHFGGVWSIIPGSALPPVAEAVSIDATTQSGFGANSNALPAAANAALVVVLNGSSAGAADGIHLTGDNISIAGLVVNGFSGAGVVVDGDDSVLRGVYVGTDHAGSIAVPNGGNGITVNGARGLVGGNNLEDRFIVSGNGSQGIEISGATAEVLGGIIGLNAGLTGALPNGANGIRLSGSTGATIGAVGGANIISGNNLAPATSDGIYISGGGSHTIQANIIGTNGVGADLGNYNAGIAISNASGVLIGGSGGGERNLIAANTYGVSIDGAGATGNSVVGNYIGTELSGSIDLGNSADGVVIRGGASSNTIGGLTPAHRNVIAGNNNDGVWITGAGTTGNVVEGNWIGFGADGSDVGNSYHGVAIENGASGNVIGGVAAGAGNRIGNSAWDGVTVVGGTGNSVLGNTIAASGDIGIDLGDDGVTANDGGDGDSGANDLLNYPVITSAIGSNGTVSVDFDLDAPAGDYRVEFFTNTAPSASGNGEGESLVGSFDVNGHPGGAASYSTSYSGVAGVYVSATTTEGVGAPFGSTSEFSISIAVGSDVLIVNSTGDGADSLPGDGVCHTGNTNTSADPECTLRAAIGEANAYPGAATIEFAMPATELGYRNLGVGRSYWRIVPATPLAAISDAGTVVDGTTQTAFAIGQGIAVNDTGPEIEIDGTTAAGNGLEIGADNAEISGFVINRFDTGIALVAGDGSIVAGNYIGPDAGGANGMVGNDQGVLIAGATNSVIGGATAADRNVISGNRLRGIAVDDWSDGVPYITDGTQIIGNYIGTDAAGSSALPYDATSSQQIGIYILDGRDAVVGTAANGNVISGNYWFGIYLWGPNATNNTIQGNIIGLNSAASGAVPNAEEGPTRSGVFVSNAPGNLIGGTGNAGNVIAGNAHVGVIIDGPTAIDNSIVGNSIYDNADLGIDLNLDGVTSNDADDADAGPNDLVNYPVISSAIESGGTVTLSGTWDMEAGWYRIETFTSSVSDSSGFGEGAVFSGSSSLYHDGTGPLAWGAAFPGAMSDVVTATATECTDNTCTDFNSTSEFSAAVVVVAPDITPPVITLLGSNPQVVEVGSAYVEAGATASDDVDGDISGSIVIDSSAVNTSAVGSYAVTYNVADAAGNDAVQVTRTVDVVDTTLPVITLLGSNPQVVEVGSAYVEAGATASDNVDGDISGSIVIDSSAVVTSSVGSYSVMYDVTDSNGNAAAQVTRTVDVVDTTLPVITLLGSNPQVVEVGSAYVEAGATASDNVDGDISGSIVIDSSAVNTSALGSYLVTYDVVDSHGNPAFAVRTVNVVDTTLPVITLLGSNPQVVEVGSAYVEAGATASDNVDGDISGSIVIDSSAVVTSSVGSYSVMYNVTDSNGNAAVQVVRTVNVVDTTAPVITLLGVNPQVVEVGSGYVEAGATASDNVDGDISGSIVIDSSAVDTSTVGSHSVTYDVADAAGNAATQVTRTVDVVDTTLPVITLLGSNPQMVEVGSGYVEAGATASDNVDGDITGAIVTDSSAVNTSMVGSYSVTYDVTDANGNDAVQVTRTVDVVDTTAPIITLVGANPETIEVGSTYTELGATALDTGDGDVTPLIVIDSTGVDTSAVGSYLVTYDVTDSEGNAAEQATRTVNVVDTTAPVITLLGANPQVVEVGSGYVEAGATASDNVDGDVSGSIVIDSSAVVTSSVGSYSVTYNVTDSNGNAATQVVRTVDVVDTTAPVISLLGANPQTVGVGSAYFEAGATALDAHDGDLTPSIVVNATAVDTTALGSFSVTYNVTDSNGNAAIEVIRTVNVVNVAPTLGALTDQTSPEGSPVTFTATATDPDPTDSLFFSLVGAPAGASIDPVNGAFTWTPSEAQGPNVFSFDVVASDSGVPALTDSHTITLTVTEVNEPPVLTSIAAQTGGELSAVIFDVPAGDPDLPGNALNFILSGAPAGASINPSTGAFSWTPTEAQGPGTYVFDVHVADDGTPSLGDTVAVTVVVTEVNASPTVANPGAQASSEADTVSLIVPGVDVDLPANSLTYSATGLPNGLSIDAASGEISGTIDYAANASSPFSVTVTATDDGSPIRSGQTTFSWTVGDTNRVPAASNDTATVAEDSSTVIDVMANDSDPDGDQVSLAGVGAPANGSASIGATGIVYRPDANFFGTDSFTYSISDARGGFATATLNVIVTPVNDSPTLSVVPTLAADELAPVTFLATATDIEGDGITFSLTGAPSGASISANGRFAWTPSELQGPASYTFRVVATDDGSPRRSVSRPVTITVAEVNAAPVVLDPGDQSSFENDVIALTVVATDRDVPAGTLRFTATGLPPGLSIDPGTGSITGTLPFDAAAGSPYSVVITVADTGTPARAGQAGFAWRVGETNRPPVVADIEIEAEAGLPAPVLLTADDPDGNTLSYRIVTMPTKGSLTGGPRLYTYTPDAAAAGVDTFTFAVSDGSAQVTGTVTAVITPNYAPIGRSDEFIVRRGGVLTIEAPGVLSNDRDPEERPITASIATLPDRGSIVLESDGSFVYENLGDAADLDTFQYRVEDGMRESVPISVRIIIEENIAPVVANDMVGTDEDVAVVFHPLENDEDPNDEPVSVLRAGDPENGSVDWTADGTFTYTPNADWNGVDTFTYEITDGDLVGVGSVTVVVTPVNDPPQASTANSIGSSGEVLTIDLRPHTYDVDGDTLTFLLEAPPFGSIEQVEPGVFAIDLDGVIQDLPPLAFVATDTAGARATALLKVTVSIPAELVGVPALISDDTIGGSVLNASDGAYAGGDDTTLVTGLRLMIGSVLGTFRAIRVPSFVLLVILLGSLWMGLSRRFVFTSSATALPLGDRKRVDIVMALSQAGVPVRSEPGTHQSVVHRFGADEAGIVTTGARSMVRSEVWVEVETPEGDAWVNSEFITEQVPAAVFAEDERVFAIVSDLVDRIYDSGDLLPVTGGHDLHIAHYGPPVRFSANSLRRLLAGASVYWWWGPDGDAPNTQSTFAETVGESVSAAYRNRGAHQVDPTVAIPIEFANMNSLVVGNHELGEGWRIFFRYEDDAPSIAGLMREAQPNPAALHGMTVRENA